MGKMGESGNLSLTYSPYLGAVLGGDQSQVNFQNPGVQSHIAQNYLASLERKVVNNGRLAFQNFEASIKDADTGYQRTPFKTFDASYKLQFNASLNKELWIQNQNKKLESELYRSASGKTLPSMQAYLAMQQFQASAPPGAQDSATSKVSPLTQIPFIQTVLGIPNEQYWINELFTKQALPQLHAEQPETDWIAALINLRPAQDTQALQPDFDSHFFEALRTEVPFILPREYRMRATIDPYGIYATAAARALREAREAKSLLALSGLPSEGTIADPEAKSTGSGLPSQNNTKREIEALIAQHWRDYRIMIDSCVCGPETFIRYESNFYTKGFAPYSDVEIWGLVNLPGFKRPIKTAISPFMQENRFYFFSSQYAFTGEGPQTTESWAKPEKNSDAGAWRDYNDITIFNPNRAGFKVTVSGQTAGSEITNLTQARNLVAPGSSILINAR